MDEPEMETVGALIARALGKPDDEAELEAVRGDVLALCDRFPLYPERWRDGA
jgi:glycine/serine hydroxymethyltransferase